MSAADEAGTGDAGDVPWYLSAERGSLPPPVGVDLDEPVVGYWRRRIEQHLQEYYAGIRLSKFPEDLRVLEQLLFAQLPEAVIELGCQFGSSSLWLADHLDTLRRYGGSDRPLVVAVDIDTSMAHDALDRTDPSWQDRIALVEGDVTDPGLPSVVEGLLAGRTNCLVIEDSAHEYDTTLSGLEGFARFVPAGGYLVVEDGVVDVERLRLRADWPSGVHRAIEDFLAGPAGAAFRRRPDLEPYGVTSHPGGYLQRGA